MSTTGKEYKLAIRIAGIVDKTFNTSLASTQTKLKAFAKTVSAVDSDFTKLDKGFNKIMSAGKTCFKAVATAAGVAGVAIGAVTAASINVGSQFESAFAGVKKTTDATAEEYEQLRQSILDMTRTIPASATEIATVMEAAGQLGIAKEALVDFTETMINLGVSTNMTSDEAATNLAKFANIMKMDNYGEDGISNYERLGSTIVDLGNKFATTEADIVAIATQLAASGKLAGMSEADIMGISAAMSSVGLTAEAGASSMSRLFMQMQQAVAGGGEELEMYADVAGVTAEDFATLFRDDAAGAVIEFIEGLNAAGEDSYGILEDLDLSTIRLRKAFLSLAGADDLMANALGIANEAWDENTALAVEAGKRYETAESKVQLMKNAFTELGIVAYDELRTPFVNTVDDITGRVNELTEYVGGADGISKWMDNIGTALPTLQRKVKQFGEPAFEFLGSIVDIGKWFLQNPEVLTSALTGIGNALIAYKTASNVSHLAQALMSLGGLNPITQGVLLLVGALGSLSIAVSAYKQYNQNLVDDNLAEHFGNIALSMEEIQRVAEYIIGSDTLGAVKTALAAFDELDGLASTMETKVLELNKMNWKVSIGMNLTPEEQEVYQTTISDYVTAAQAYAEQSQYAVAINLKLAMGDDSGKLGSEDNLIYNQVNSFYAENSAEMTRLGTQLNDAVTEAFNDGLLEIDEAEKIANIQAQMAAIQEALATGEFEAQLSVLGMEYQGGGGLTADTFQNLQAELSKQVESATATYRESYTKAYASIQAAYEGGKLTEDQYSAGLNSILAEYQQNVGGVQAKALNFQLETIMGQYASELDPAVASYMDSIQQVLEDYSTYGEWDWMDRPVVLWNGMMQAIADSSSLDKTTRGAISQLLEAMQPTVTEMEALKLQYEEMGQEVPQAIVDGLSEYNMLNALANADYASITTLLGEQMVEGGTFDTFYQDILTKLSEQEYYIPEGLASGISTAASQLAAEQVTTAGEAAIPPAVDGVYALADTNIITKFAAGFNADAELRLTLNPKITNYSAIQNFVDNNINGFNANLQIGQRAKGGLATSPELTWFAEEGPEMAIPIDGSQNAINLWEQTGRLLGMDSVLDGVVLDGGTSSTIQYNPTLQFYGEAPSKSDLTDALRISQDEFENLMERYLKTQGRVSFA